ncbi:MAG: hypothetical protein R2854_23355 [Caldilineaceae bacterium]
MFLAVVISLGLSFSDWGLTGWKGFTGLSNYRSLLRDPVFWKAFRNTVFYIVTAVLLQLALGLLLAVMLNQGRGQALLPRHLLHAPVVTTHRRRGHRLSPAAQQQRPAGRRGLLVRRRDRSRPAPAGLAQQHALRQVGGGRR